MSEVTAELIVGEDLQLEFAVGRLLDLFRRFARIDIERMGLRHVGAQLEGKFGGSGVAQGDGGADRGKASYGSKTATR